MKYLFKTRLGQWWHCLVYSHQSLTAYTYDINGRNRVLLHCLQCLDVHDSIVQKLKRARRMGR